MNASEERIADLYQISLAISRESSLQATAERALSAYLDHLVCSAGAVLERREGLDGSAEYRLVTAVPADPYEHAALRTAIQRLPAGRTASFPVRGETKYGTSYWVLDLPEFGALVLASDVGLEDETVAELGAVNAKLAEACRGNRAEAELREERNRFETVFETFQEPVVHCILEEEPIVKRVNAAFEETFGYTEAEAVGESINDLVVPDGDQAKDEAEELDEYARKGRTMTREVRRETADGTGHFLYRGMPVETADADEYFGMYVDITDEKARQRRLEQLYEEAEEIFGAKGREAVCRRAVTAIEEIVDLSAAAIHLYDRSTESLVPAATTSSVDSDPSPYTDRESIAWEVYESGEPVSIDDAGTLEGAIRAGELQTGSVIVLPLGGHGVLVISSQARGAFDDADFYFARLLSTLVVTALDRTRRAEGLEGIQAVTRETLEASTHEEVAEAVLDRIPDLLDMPLSTIWEYDAGTEALEPLASTEKALDMFAEIPTFSGEGSVAWRAFQDGSIVMIPDIEDHPEVLNEDSIIGSEVVVPIGEFGVLVTGSTYTGSFGRPERRLLETLSANLETTMRLTSRRREMELLDQLLARILRHNIRNDLTIIQGYAREIQRNGNREAAASAQRIIDTCESLQATAEHAREIRQIVTRRDRRERLSLREVVERITAGARSEYPHAAIESRIGTDADVVVHPDLPIALRHLVENAIEHDSTGTRPQVEISVFESPSGVVLEVADDGPGIPDHETEVLDRHAESALDHGSGVGLWIVDRVVDYSGATVSFSTTDEGTVARIEFER